VVAYLLGDLAARGDAELAEHLVQVELHSGDRDEEPLGYLGVSVTASGQDGDVPLLRGQLVPRGYRPLSDLLAGGEQLRARPLGERGGAAGFEHLAAAAFGGLDILVNNVGAVRPRTDGFSSVTAQDWLATLAVNFLAAVHVTRLALPLLSARGGSIVTISSVNAALPDPLVIDYSAAKGALSNF
jgi:NAD(P)-dependent dehydrogenase (short-subunit alcohol dehydrogenase family)